jgi:hypothetical protein
MPPRPDVIAVGQNGWTDIEPDLLPEREGSASGFHKPWWRDVSLYHRSGTRYEVSKATPVGPVPSKLLASTFYNPRLRVRYEYRAAGLYSIEDLKSVLSQAIYRDPDVLTQFHGADELTARVSSAASFDDLVEVLRYAATEDAD